MKNNVGMAIIALAIIVFVAPAAMAGDAKKSRVELEIVWDSVSETEAINLLADTLHRCGWACDVKVKVSAAGVNIGGGGTIGKSGPIDAGIEADHDEFVAD